MRAHTSEHRDSLPVLDVTALRHIAFVLDGIIYYMRSGNDITDSSTQTAEKTDPNLWSDQDENDNDDTEDELNSSLMENDSVDDDFALGLNSLGRRHGFFQRSESTLCLGCPAPDPFSVPLEAALPLADKPHLLQPAAKREELFSNLPLPITVSATGNSTEGNNSNIIPTNNENNINDKLNINNVSPLEVPPMRLGLSPAYESLLTQRSNRGSGTTAATTTVEINNDVEMENQDEDEDDEEEQTGINDQETVVLDEENKHKDGSSGTTSAPISATTSVITENEDVDMEKKIEPSPSTSRQSESFGNLYVQLKKKNYYDQHEEEDPKNRAEQQREQQTTSSTINETTSSHLQQQSTSTRMEVDSYENTDNTQVEKKTEEKPIRPQIIVTPRKVAAAIESVKAEVLAKNNKSSLAECAPTNIPVTLLPSFSVIETENGETSTLSDTSTTDTSNSTNNSQNTTGINNSISPSQPSSSSKSVIVRAGPSTSSLSTATTSAVSILCNFFSTF